MICLLRPCMGWLLRVILGVTLGQYKPGGPFDGVVRSLAYSMDVLLFMIKCKTWKSWKAR